MVHEREIVAMRRAIDLARTPGVPAGPNPRVGCVILDRAGETVGEGWHRGAGTPHAEPAALESAGERARGGTAVVTLEPCTHVGRTGPCTEALIAAGISRVVFGQVDPHGIAAGGAAALRRAGIDVEGPVLTDEVAPVTEAWTFAITGGRPFVTWKVAATLDGRVAALDGSSRWITGAQSRAMVHDLRGDVDAIAVGTGTVIVDDPHLSARDASGNLRGAQPLRVVVGLRDLPETARVLDGSAPTLQVRSRDPREVLAVLAEAEIRHLLLEGGPTLSAAFLRAGLVDRVVWYVAPTLLGAGESAVGDLGIVALDAAIHLTDVRVDLVGEDVRIVGRPRLSRQ